MKPKLAAFPKCYIDDLCVHQTMTLFDWIGMASTLGVDGLEFYSGFLKDELEFLEQVKDQLKTLRNSRRRILPEGVRGIDSTKRISRGCL